MTDHLKTCKGCGRFLRACTCGVVKHSLGVAWGNVRDFRDEAGRQIDAAVRGALFLRFGEVSDEDIRKGGLIKSWPDRDEYLYQGQHFVTVYRPAPAWNGDNTIMSLEYRIEFIPQPDIKNSWV